MLQANVKATDADSNQQLVSTPTDYLVAYQRYIIDFNLNRPNHDPRSSLYCGECNLWRLFTKFRAMLR